MSAITDFVSAGGGVNLVVLDRQIFTSSGTWTKPADQAGNVAAGINKRVFVRAIGGGASGRSVGTSNTSAEGGGGGGGVEAWFDVADVSATETVTVGAGGAANNSSSTGNAGGDSSFGALCGATGAPATRAQGSRKIPSQGGQGYAANTALYVRTSQGGKGGDYYDLSGRDQETLPARSSTIGGGGGGAAEDSRGFDGAAGGGASGGAGGRLGTDDGTAGGDCPAGTVLGGGGGGGADNDQNGGDGGNYGGGGGAGGGNTTAEFSGAGGPGAVLVEVWGEVG